VNAVNAVQTYSDCVDVWAIQSYRGVSFFGLINQLSGASNLPLVMTEYGVDSYNNVTQSEDQDMQVTGSTKLFNELAMYALQNKITGGFFFQYADIWWKFGSPFVQDYHGWAAGGFPDKVANEEWWGIFKISPGSPNVLTPRKMFDALKTLHANTNPYGVIKSYLDNVGEATPDPNTAPTIEPYTPKTTSSTASSKNNYYIIGGSIVGAFALVIGGVLVHKHLKSRNSEKKQVEENPKTENTADDAVKAEA
jgi:hypothetical protein